MGTANIRLYDFEICDKMTSNLSEFYTFGIRSSINQQTRTPLKVKSNNLYKICFAISKAKSMSGCSILCFSYSDQQPVIPENTADYETYFTKDLLSKEALILSGRLGLFNPQLPMMYLVNQNQQRRINEIFTSMADEDAGALAGRNGIIKTLIHELILLTQRLITVDINSD